MTSMVLRATVAHPLDIEAQAKRRLADEYDAAQERGEVGRSGARTDLVPKGNEVIPPASAAGLTRKTVHEARVVRDAEKADPGIVRRALDAMCSAVRQGTIDTKPSSRRSQCMHMKILQARSQ